MSADTQVENLRRTSSPQSDKNGGTGTPDIVFQATSADIRERTRLKSLLGGRTAGFQSDGTVIGNSSYWKDDLLRLAGDLARRRAQRRWSDASFGRVEVTLMKGFYAIRKLIEAHLISDSLSESMLTVRVYAATGKRVTYMNRHKIDHLYDLEHSRRETRSLTFVCNQVVHSYVFQSVLEERGGLEGFMFSSDRERNRCLLHLAARDVVKLFQKVGNNYPASGTYEFDDGRGDYVVRMGEG